MNARARLADIALAAFLAHGLALLVAFLLSVANFGPDEPTPATEALANASRIVVRVLGFPLIQRQIADKIPDGMALPLLILNSAIWAAAVVLIVQVWRRARQSQAKHMAAR